MIKFKKVTILGVPYQVKVVNQEKLAELTGDPMVIGLCDGLDDIIYMASELRGKGERRTFIHEWTHGVKDVIGLNQTIDTRTAEIICQSMANAILELFDQREIMRFLTSKSDK